MTGRELFLIASCLLSACGCGESARTGPRLVAPGVVNLRSSETSEQPLQATVSIVNVGDADLHLLNVGTSCQCTVAEQIPDTLAPGAAAELVIKVKSQDAAGSSVVRIESDDPYQRVTEITLRWAVAGQLHADPPRVDFGALRAGETVERVVLLHGAGENCSPGTPICSPAELQVEGLSATRVTIRLTAGENPGDRTGSVRLPFADCSRLPVRIPVDWSVHNLVEATPTRLFLGTAAPGQRLQKPIVVRTVDHELSIANVRVLDLQGASAKVTGDSGSSRVVTVEWTAPERAGAFTGSIIVDCEQPAGVKIEVPVSAIVLDAA